MSEDPAGHPPPRARPTTDGAAVGRRPGAAMRTDRGRSGALFEETHEVTLHRLERQGAGHCGAVRSRAIETRFERVVPGVDPAASGGPLQAVQEGAAFREIEAAAARRSEGVEPREDLERHLVDIAAARLERGG